MSMPPTLNWLAPTATCVHFFDTGPVEASETDCEFFIYCPANWLHIGI